MLLFADGGTLLLKQQAGPLTISVFGAPEPLRAGPADLSVMVQQTNDRSTILDATVKFHLIQSAAGDISEVFAPATHANAANKLLYAARVNLPKPGVWRLIAEVESKRGSAEVAGEINVLGPQPAIVTYWPYFAFVPLIIMLFVINQWLKRNRVNIRRSSQ
jgi:hypothetical protein